MEIKHYTNQGGEVEDERRRKFCRGTLQFVFIFINYCT